MFEVAIACVLLHCECQTCLIRHTGIPTLNNILILGLEVPDVSSIEVLIHEQATCLKIRRVVLESCQPLVSDLPPPNQVDEEKLYHAITSHVQIRF